MLEIKSRKIGEKSANNKDFKTTKLSTKMWRLDFFVGVKLCLYFWLRNGKIEINEKKIIQINKNLYCPKYTASRLIFVLFISAYCFASSLLARKWKVRKKCRKKLTKISKIWKRNICELCNYFLKKRCVKVRCKTLSFLLLCVSCIGLTSGKVMKQLSLFRIKWRQILKLHETIQWRKIVWVL